MQTLIALYQGLPGSWAGPCKPIKGAYPVLEAVSISEPEAVERIAQFKETSGWPIVEWRIHTDKRTQEDADREYAAEAYYERRRESLACGGY